MSSAKQRDTVNPETFLASYSPEVQAIANALRQLVKATVPDVHERVALGWQLIGYHVPDGSRSRYFCFVAPLAQEVRLGFEYGFLLDDQMQLEGEGSQVRYVTLHTLDAIDPLRLSPLIAEAAMVVLARGVR